MEALVRVDGLDSAGACSLCERFAVDFTTRADLASGGSSVEIQTGGPLSDVLHRLEEWTKASGRRSICVNLDGRAYVLEAAAPPAVAGAEELLPSVCALKEVRRCTK